MKNAMLAAVAAWATAVLALGTGAEAQTVETITILGTRLEEELPQELARTGVRVDTIGTSEIKNGGYLDTGTALQSLAPGLYVSSRSGPFDYVDLSYQGSRTQDILFLVDGIRINNRLYAGTTPLDTIPASMIERVEVLEGGQALFYGTQATAAAVNIVSKGFTDKLDGTITLGGGMRGNRHIDGYVRGPILPNLASQYFVLYGSHDQADGFEPFRDEDFRPSATQRDRGYDVTTIGGKYRLDWGDAVRFTANYLHSDVKLDFQQPTLVQTSFNERAEDLLSAKLDYAPLERVQVFFKGYYHWWRSHFTELDNQLDTEGIPTGALDVVDDHDFWGFRDYGTNAMAKVGLGAGLETLFGYDYQNYTGRDAVLVIEQQAEHVHAFFGQLQTTPELFVDGALAAGFRYNAPSVGDSAVVWNVNGIYHATDWLYGRGLVGTAFRLPTAEELFANDPNNERGNSDLKPERSTNANAAIGGDLAPWRVPVKWEVVGFWREIKDLIDLDIFDETTNQDVFGNLPGKVRVRGVEVRADSALTDDVGANFDFTYNRARQSGSSEQLRRIPETLAKAGLDYHPVNHPFGASLNVVNVGDVNDTLGDIGRVGYGNHTVLNLAARVFFDEKRHHRVSVYLNNVFDDDYTSHLNRGTEDTADASFIVRNVGEPRTVFVSYTYSLN